MKFSKIVALSILGIALTVSSCKEPAPGNPGEGSEELAKLECTEKSSFAVVELFTSEGCSSCPTVDNLINGYVKDDADKNILYISEHVDYWNKPLPGPCGVSQWDDPFSDARYTSIQNTYRQKLNFRGMVTPQLVFGGESGTYDNSAGTIQFTTAAIRGEITRQLDREATSGIAVRLKNLDESGKEVEVEYATLDAPAKSTLYIFLVEKGLVQKVTAGENCNKTLEHENVAREFVVIKNPEEHGFATISWKSDVNLQNAEVFAYIRHNKTQEIKAATKGFKLQ